MGTIQIAFEIQATCQQVIKVLNNKWDEDRIIEGLKTGMLVTSTWINEGEGTFLEDLSGNVIGRIVSQQVDGDYSDFR